MNIQLQYINWLNPFLAIFLALAIPSQAQAQAMEIYVNNSQGRTMTLVVKANDTIGAVKQRIQETVGVPSGQQLLMFGAKQLEDGRTLVDYSINNRSILLLDVRPR